MFHWCRPARPDEARLITQQPALAWLIRHDRREETVLVGSDLTKPPRHPVAGNRADTALVSAGKRKVRVAIVGCGAIARQFHLPVLAGHPYVSLTALVEPDVSRARELASAYGVGACYGDAEQLEPGAVDAVVIATPPSHHAPCAIRMAQRGLHVLVEKPMAVRYEDALAMVQTADEAGVVLSVGLFRRLFPCTRLAKAVLDSGMLGRPVGFDIEEGDVYGWQAATLGNLRRDLAGGGALMDYGSHTLDRLLFLFGGAAQVLEYRDTSLGGIEADCRLRLRLLHNNAPVEGTVELSRTRKLRNAFRIRCQRGSIEFGSQERFRLAVKLDGVDLVDPLQAVPRDYRLDLSWSKEPETDGYEYFKAEIDDWLEAIRTGRSAQLSGRSVLPVVKLIEDCYRNRQLLEEPWVHDCLQKPTPAPPDVEGRHAMALVAPNGSPVGLSRPSVRRVLVTGATGFVGCRLAEILRLREGFEVRALVHSSSKAARLAQLPVEMVMGDLGSAKDAARLVDGCDAVVHCAVGTAWRNRRALFDITVGGTRRLAEAARAAGVRRFVHISTFAVHDLKKAGVLDETAPIAPARGSDYAESKVAAEHVIARAVAGGLSAVIIRPGCVYGPFSQIFTTGPIQCMAQGRFALVGPAWEAPSSTVYIDNIVEAIVRALNAPDERVRGEVFTVSDGDAMTWGAFYGYFADALGLELRTVSEQDVEQRREKHRGMLAWAGSSVRGFLEVARSAELRAFARKVLNTEPVCSMGRFMLQRLPRLKSTLRRFLKLNAPPLYRQPPVPVANMFEFEISRPLVNIAKARAVLGYVPVVPRARAMELTLQWVRHARLLP